MCQFQRTVKTKNETIRQKQPNRNETRVEVIVAAFLRARACFYAQGKIPNGAFWQTEIRNG